MGTRYLVSRSPRQAEDERWVFLPDLDVVNRIEGLGKRLSFSGSHFVYEDITGRPDEADRCEFMSFDIADHYWIKCVPKNAKDLEFQYYLVWIRKDNFIPVKFEYYDDKGQLVRLLEVLLIQEIQGYPTVTRLHVKDLKGGGESHVEIEDVRYNVGLNEEIFLPENLKKDLLPSKSN